MRSIDHQQHDSESLSFDTRGEWRASEVSTLLESVSTLYGVFLSIHTSRELRRVLSEPLPKASIAEIFQNLPDFTREVDQLRIEHVKMGSPGFFRFAGLAAPIRELGSLLTQVLLVVPIGAVTTVTILGVLRKLLKRDPYLNDPGCKDAVRWTVSSLMSILKLVKTGKIVWPGMPATKNVERHSSRAAPKARRKQIRRRGVPRNSGLPPS